MRVKGKLYRYIYKPLINKQLFSRCNKIVSKQHWEINQKHGNLFYYQEWLDVQIANICIALI